MNDMSARVRHGTALRQRGKERVQKILRSARTLFLTKGYEGLSLRSVAELSDISLGNLTYYFGSKGDLFESMIDDVLGEYGGRLEQISEQHVDDPAAQLDAYLSFLFADCQRTEAQQFFYQFWALGSRDAFVAKARDRTYAVFAEQLTDYCQQLNPELKNATINERMLLLMAHVEGLHIIFGIKGLPKVDLDRLEKEFKRQILAAIGHSAESA
ncbi:MAG: TetR/AcrR family transcriptional regulator [Woeseia sp.]|jgi:AcrR family transcriptional regulator|nr:TetR/AcrR family transcriptional regulator [Woeseia sp.]MBT6209918.1 TetR/AcrR family transcriptional regulator [Woeseia sp.]